MTEFLQSPHHPTLKRLMLDVEKAVDRHLLQIANGHTTHLNANRQLKERVRSFAELAIQSGKQRARELMPVRLDKTGARFDWDVDADIDRIIATFHVSPTPLIRDAFHEAARLGGGASRVVHQLEKVYQADKARDLGRTIYLNLYTKASLREMQANGYQLCRRIEIDDHKTCVVCWALNNGTYHIADIVDLPDPLTHDTHPRCRGSFVPVLNSMTALPQKKGRLDFVKTIQDPKTGVEIKDAPLEYSTYLSSFARKHRLPFKVEFDPRAQADSQVSNGVLTVHPRTLFDQDPREVILEAWAATLWPKYEARFTKEYVLLARMGLTQPQRSVHTALELWIREFTAWKMNQLDSPWDILWFRTTVRE
jgi:hypothetical protein